MLARKIKDYIVDSGYKFSAIATKIGMNSNNFCALLNGRRKITADEYVAICRALNVSLDTFVDVSEVTDNGTHNH